MTRPAFENPEFENLYERDYFIDDAVLRGILALGPETAVPELVKIATHTLDNFSFAKMASAHYSDTYYFFHSLYLLHELSAPEALDVYRRVLRLDSVSIEFWFGEELFEEVPELLARAGQARLPQLLALLEDQQLTLRHRLVVADAVSRLSRIQPELRPAISEFMQRYLRHLIANADQLDQLLPAPAKKSYGYESADYLGMLLTYVQEADLRELEPEVRQLHRLGLVDEGFSGGEDDIDFTALPLQPSLDIFARYQELRDIPDNHSPYHPDAAAIAQRQVQKEAEYARQRMEMARSQPPQPRQALPKVGRNDPCPCGSGQKFKKCHGG